MISSIGDRRSTAWDNAPGPSTITRTDALAAVNDGRRALDEGFFRAKLINKGLVYAPEHGQIAYTVSGMADFIRRQLNLEPNLLAGRGALLCTVRRLFTTRWRQWVGRGLRTCAMSNRTGTGPSLARRHQSSPCKSIPA